MREELYRPPHSMSRDRIPVVVEPHQAWTLRLELLPNRPLTNLRMAVRAGIGDTLIEQRG